MQIVEHKLAIDWPLLISTIPLENGANKIVTDQQWHMHRVKTQIKKVFRAA